ncbi:hypothetical protein HBH79_242880 [Parastagonospora nodorum]|nr:hypothetical protein HBH50_227800 [Parastagonospora nodorum]KAH4078754.1 hypothetical protein HBH48_226650 [Parastagonospora nodorum]KAH4288348.1 hypothetical protein HBI01_221710 [Parastagonospora nodorum]KAH4391182.1 hypothetical protein HBH94_025350 [Parastagonospora nodorum]KAH4400623.1 hypothetical protein HBH92_231230 [Parastagonospora nodorum]
MRVSTSGLLASFWQCASFEGQDESTSSATRVRLGPATTHLEYYLEGLVLYTGIPRRLADLLTIHE